MATSLVTRLHPMAKTEDFASSRAAVPADWSSRTCVLTTALLSNVATPTIPAPLLVVTTEVFSIQLFACNNTTRCTADGSSCDPAARTLACEILAAQEAGKVRLKDNHFSAAGNSPYDGASAMSNIRDTCYGRRVKRSR